MSDKTKAAIAAREEAKRPKPKPKKKAARRPIYGGDDSPMMKSAVAVRDALDAD